VRRFPAAFFFSFFKRQWIRSGEGEGIMNENAAELHAHACATFSVSIR
jgi:hypothetical protein